MNVKWYFKDAVSKTKPEKPNFAEQMTKRVKKKKRQTDMEHVDWKRLKRLDKLNAMNHLWLDLTENNIGHWDKWENRNMCYLRSY